MRVLRWQLPIGLGWSDGLLGGLPGGLAMTNEANGLGAVDARSPARDQGASAGTTDQAEQELFLAVLPLYAETLLRVAAALVGPADAEDASQEAIVRAWQAWPKLRDPAAARAWLLRITVNVCRDWRRGRFGTRQRMNMPLDEEYTGANGATGGFSGARGAPPTFAQLGADPGASDHAAALDLRRAVNLLDDDLRLVVALRYYAGMDATAVGAALGIPAGTVRTRLRRALAALRVHLSAPDDIADAADEPTALQRREGRR